MITPEPDWLDPEALLELLGSFWQGGPATDQVGAYVAALGEVAAGLIEDLDASLNGVARESVPTGFVTPWAPLRLVRSELARSEAEPIGDGAIGDGRTIGAPGPPQFAAPAPWSFAPILVDRPLATTRTWIAGLDYLLVDGRIRFAADPFESLEAEPVLGPDGTIVDETATLWAYRPTTDRDRLGSHFGFAVGLSAVASSEIERERVNALHDAIVGGTARADLERLIAAACDAPAAMEDGEVVEHVDRDLGDLLVVTDHRIYRHGPSATATVVPGATLHAGQPLSDAWRIDDFRNGQIPEGLSRIVTGSGLLAEAGTYAAGLGWVDAATDLTAQRRADGSLFVSWSLGGHPEDVERFWEETHRRGLASGFPLAEALDMRVERPTPVEPENLPATINPLAFLCAHWLRRGALLLRVNPAAFGRSAPGLTAIRQARWILPPTVALIVQVELPRLDAAGTVASGADSGSADPTPPRLDDAPILSDMSTLDLSAGDARCANDPVARALFQ